VCKSPAPVSVLSQMDAIYILQLSLPKIRFNIIVSTRSSSEWLVSVTLLFDIQF
jgi:hypothetical protein